MIGFLLKRPVAVIMSTIAFLVLGAVAMFQLPVSLMPDVDIPEISIYYTQDNASVNEMENSITNFLIDLDKSIIDRSAVFELHGYRSAPFPGFGSNVR